MLECTAGGTRPRPPLVSSPPPRRPRVLPDAVTPARARARARARKPGKRPVSPFYLGDEEDAREREVAAVRQSEKLSAIMDQVEGLLHLPKAPVRAEDDSGVFCGSDEHEGGVAGEESGERRRTRERIHARDAEGMWGETDGAGCEEASQEQVTGRKRGLLQGLASEGSDAEDFVEPKRVRVTVVPSRRRSTQSSAKKAGHSSGSAARPSQQTPPPLELATAPAIKLGNGGSRAARPVTPQLQERSAVPQKPASEIEPTKWKRNPIKFRMPTPRKPFSARVHSAGRTQSPDKKSWAVLHGSSSPTPPALSPEPGNASALSPRHDDLLLSPDFPPNQKPGQRNSKGRPSKAKSLFPDESDEVLHGEDSERSLFSSGDDVALVRPIMPAGRSSSQARPDRRRHKVSSANARSSEGAEQCHADAPSSSARRRLRRVAPDSDEENESSVLEPGKAPQEGFQKKLSDAAIVISLDSGSESGGECVALSRQTPSNAASLEHPLSGSKRSKLAQPTPGRRTLSRAALQYDNVGSLRPQQVMSASDSDDSIVKPDTARPKSTPGRRRLDKSVLASEPFPRRRAKELRFDSDSDEVTGNSDSNMDDDDDVPIVTAPVPSARKVLPWNKAKKSASRTKSQARRSVAKVVTDEADRASAIVVVRRTPKAYAGSASQDDKPADVARRDNWMNEREINDFSDSSEQELPSSHLPCSTLGDASKCAPVFLAHVESRRRRKSAPSLQDTLTRNTPALSVDDQTFSQPRQMASSNPSAVFDLDGDGDENDNVCIVVEEDRDRRRRADSLREREARGGSNMTSRKGASQQQKGKSNGKATAALSFDDGYESDSMDQLLKLEAAADDADYDGPAEDVPLEPDVLSGSPNVTSVNSLEDAGAGQSAGPAPFEVRSLFNPGETPVEMFHRLGEDAVMDAVFQAQEEGRRIVGGECIGLDSAAMASQEAPGTNFLQNSNFGKTTETKTGKYSKSKYTPEMAHASLSGAKERHKQKFENKFGKKGRSTWKKKSAYSGKKKRK